MDYDKLLKKNRRKPIVSPEMLSGETSFTLLNFGQDQIKKIIPHRDPFLLVEKLTAVDLSEGEECIVGTRIIPASDPVFQGHFPDFPVYPGSLQLEMGGQLGLCLTHFFLNKTTEIPADASPSPVRATKVLGALFLAPLLPEKEVTLIAKKLEFDGYFGTVLSQVVCEDKVCCVSISEVIFLDD